MPESPRRSIETHQPGGRQSLRRAPRGLILFALAGWSCSGSDPVDNNPTSSVGATTDGATTDGATATATASTATSATGTTASTANLTSATSATTASLTAGSTGSATTSSSVTGAGGASSVGSASGGSAAGGASASTSGTETSASSTGGSGGTGMIPEPNGVCPFTSSTESEGANWVRGELLEFNDNGGWCWYQDERVLVDEAAGELIISSVASGGSREAHVEIVHWDIEAKQGQLHHLDTMAYTDDHDVPAIVRRPDGGYLAMWAGHNDDCNSYYSVYDGSSWSAAEAFGWPECPTPSGKRITYANAWYLGDTAYSFVRSIDTSPHYLFSENGGTSWTLGGRLTSTPQVGYVAGYYKYWGNNTDRIDFFGTEAHPRDNDNSLYHGYIKDGKIHDSMDRVVDADFTDRSAEEVPAYTQVFATGTTINGVRLEHMWNADLVRYDDGTIAAIGSGRVAGSGSDDPDKRLLYFRFDGTSWTTTYLAKAGTKLYSSEQDYTGLGALHPDNPHVIYISTPYDPRTDEGDFTGKKEIWKGVTCDDGASFDWEPVTANSTMDNLRPVVPKWDTEHTALLWLRGSYASAQSYTLKVVGLIEETAP